MTIRLAHETPAAPISLLLIVGLAVGAWWYTSRPPTSLTLTGIVTTNHIVVSPQITGRITELLAQEGDAVKAGQLLAVLSPDELREERAFYSFSAEGAGSQVARERSGAAPAGAAERRPDHAGGGDARLHRVAARRHAGRARQLEGRLRAHAAHDEGRRGHAPGARHRAHGVRREPVAARRAAQADRGAEGGRRAGAIERRAGAMRRSQVASNRSSSRPRPPRSAPRPTCASPTPRSTRPSTASWTCARRCPARSSRPGSRSSR